MSVERLLAFGQRNPYARAVGQHPKALLVVHQVGFHDLIEHMLMHCGIEQRNEGLDTSIEIALHEVRGRNEHSGLRVGQSVTGAERVDARVLQEPSDDRFDSNVVR